MPMPMPMAPIPPPVPMIPVTGIFELFGPVMPPPPIGIMGKYGGQQFGGKGIMGGQDMFGMSMHNFFPKVGNYQYYQYNYDPNWRSYSQGKSEILKHNILLALEPLAAWLKHPV